MTAFWYFVSITVAFGFGWFCCSLFEEQSLFEARRKWLTPEQRAVQRMLDEQMAKRWDDDQ